MISSNAVASTASGLVLILIAGIFNGSWNASFSPRANLAVGRLQPKHKSDSKELDSQKGTAPSVSESPLSTDLTYHHAFALFQFYAALINIPICLFWAGGIERVDAILRQTPAASITLVILFSILWGFGTLLFGLACRIAGVGLGTNLSMGLIAVLGTFLPLLTEQTLFTNVGGVICLGLSVCCVGLAFATMALAKRDQDEHRVMILLRSSNKKDVNEIVECNLRKTGDGDDVELAGKLKDEVTIPSSKVNNDGNDSDNIYNDNATGSEGTYKTWQKVLVCVATAVFATQLQFAFIFGAPIVDLALNRNNDTNENEDGVMLLPGSTPASGGAAIIWLFAICLARFNSSLPEGHALVATLASNRLNNASLGGAHTPVRSLCDNLPP